MPAATREEAALARSQAVVQRTQRPSQRQARHGGPIDWRSPDRAAAAASAPMPARMAVERAAGGGDEAGTATLRGYATTYGQPYEMWDFYGSYQEVVEAGAGAASLAASPDVKTLFNHDGMPMARTRTSETLELSEDDHGLLSVSEVDLRLTVAREVVLAIEADLIDEMSFAFVIERGLWSPDYTQYTIKQYTIDRGDVSPVTYGANPTTDIGVERASDADDQDRRTLSAEQQQRARRILAGHLAG